MERLGGENVCRYCLEQAPAVSEPWIVVYRGSDVLEAQLLFGLLRSDGFAARLLGTQTAALLGAAQHVFELRIEVASPEADEAFALISAFRREERSCGHGQEDS